MRKVFISFLGTNNYIPCNYISEDFESVKNVRFIQEATISWYCTGWSEQDELFVFTTDEAYEKNWLDNGQKELNGEVIQCDGLKRRISLLKNSTTVSPIRIPSGENEAEIWDIFTCVFEKIKNGDELYFDITHAFRSLPLLAMVIINYAKITKNVRVKAIGYGAMEAIGDIRQVKLMDIKKRNVPVFNLLPFDQLLDWATAIDKFLGAGDASGVQKLTTENITPILSATKGQDREAASLRQLSKCLGDFSQTLATCRGKNIVEDASKLKDALNKVKHQQRIKPLAPLLQKLESAIADFSNDEVEGGVAAARWCLQHGLVQQGFTLLLETMLTFILKQSTDEDTNEIAKRNLVGMAVHIETSKKPHGKWSKQARENRVLVEKICDWLHIHDELLGCMKNLTKDRNDLHHAGMNNNDNPMAAEKFAPKLQHYLGIFEDQLFVNKAK